MPANKAEREWHLRNVVETTKGREQIRELYQGLKKGKKSATKVAELTAEVQLNEMIEAILADEFPG